MVDTLITIPKLPVSKSVYEGFPVVGKPGWFPVTDIHGNTLKPLIRCNCGGISGIGLHHVHSNGTITNSFFHKRGNVYPEDPNGCGWHVWLKLANWSGEDIGPDKK